MKGSRKRLPFFIIFVAMDKLRNGTSFKLTQAGAKKTTGVMKVCVVGIISLLLLTTGCWNERAVTITKDYVINPNWDEVDNSFEVCRMKLKDSSKTIDLKDPADTELENGLIEDTSFSYIGFVEYNGEDYNKRKVYFNKDNGFLWWGDLHKSSSTKEILGELQQETWYLLAGLSRYRIVYYIYLDTSDSLHVYLVSGMTNW